MACLFLADGIVSRSGILDNHPWLRSDAPGPFTVGWVLKWLVIAGAIGVGTGYFWYKMIRFPNLQERSKGG